ncbi:hypothetical protein [Mesorhizobium sp. B2-7-3]|uniref:hypothetical protein n=1 Tax=Mesorhizobium sp. B2-7-3 TaxID=2589907 RepID=UPI0015E291AD|nr:hypothetical protein [Mesorhizobium sp. B2-7-3]
MPENSRPSRLDEDEQALLALECEVAADGDGSGTRASVSVRRPMADRRGDCLLSRLRFPTTMRLRVSADGSALIEAARVEMGMGTATVQIQHAAKRPSLWIDKVWFE